MRKVTLYIALLFISIYTVNAQQQKGHRIKLLKTSYITNAVNLTPKEAEKFWPIYNLYSEKIQELKFSMEKGLQHQINTVGSIDQLTEKQAQNYIDKLVKEETLISETKVKMLYELSKILSPKKILKLQKAEIDFNRKMLQEYGKRRRMLGQGNKKGS